MYIYIFTSEDKVLGIYIYIYAYIHSKDKVLVYRYIYIYITPRTKSWTTKKPRPCSGHCLSGRLVTVSMYLYIYIHRDTYDMYMYLPPRTKSWYIYIYAYIHSKDKVLVYRYIYIYIYIYIYNSKDKVLDYKKTTSLFGTLPVRQASYCFDVSIYRHRDTYDMYMYLPPRTKSWYIYIYNANYICFIFLP